MRVSVFESKKVIYEGNAKEVVLPGKDGEFSVWDFHQDFLYTLGKGFIKIMELSPGIRKIKRSDVFERKIEILHGLAKMKKNELVILVEPTTIK
jgi:F0F1-type ATP synthase epsilon subunit